METTTKFTEEELKSIQEIQQEYQNKVVQLGQVELEKIFLKQRQESVEKLDGTVKEEFSKLQDKERELVKGLNEKYGPGTLNPQTGEFTPAPPQPTAPAVPAVPAVN